MKPLEEIDPELLNQAVLRVCANRERAPHKEAAIARSLSASSELLEWAQMMAEFPPPDCSNPKWAMFMSAISIGMEVGYELGQHEAKREAGPFK